MVITYYINLIRKVANRHSNTSVSILLLVAETIRNAVNIYFAKTLPSSISKTLEKMQINLLDSDFKNLNKLQ